MREETTTLLWPSAWRKETGFCSDWPERDLLLPGDHSLDCLACITPKHKLLQMMGLLCYIRQYHSGGRFAELKTLFLRQTKRCSEISPRCQCDKHHNAVIQRYQQCDVWLDDRKDSRKMSSTFMKPFLWCFVKLS